MVDEPYLPIERLVECLADRPSVLPLLKHLYISEDLNVHLPTCPLRIFAETCQNIASVNGLRLEVLHVTLDIKERHLDAAVKGRGIWKSLTACRKIHVSRKLHLVLDINGSASIRSRYEPLSWQLMLPDSLGKPKEYITEAEA